MSVIIGKVGLSTNLDSAPIENGFKYTEDTGELYLDYGNGDDAKRVRVSTPTINARTDTTYNDIYDMLVKFLANSAFTNSIFIGVFIANIEIDTDGNTAIDTVVNGFGTLSMEFTDNTSIKISIQCGDWVFKETLTTTQDGDRGPDTSDEKWQHTLGQSTTKFRISGVASQIATAAAFSTKYATMLDIIGNHK